MNDSAKGPSAGYIFQFEKALLMLSKLNADECISIENVDDIAIHNSKSVLLTVQAKHSISSSGSTFEDTSYSLWRTFQIWIEKIDLGIFSKDTKFVCSTNKKILKSSLLSTIINEASFDKIIEDIEDLLLKQENKLNEIKTKRKSSGKHVEKIIVLMKFVLSKRQQFKLIKEQLLIEDNESIREGFYNELNLGSDNFTSLQRENIFESLNGWLVQIAATKWRNSKEAIISKKDFDEKWFQINSNLTIVNAVFRTKKQLESIGLINDSIINEKKTELFVKQLEDIKWRNDVVEEIIKDAIIDFVYHDNELVEIIKIGNYTEEDFDEFIQHCFKKWGKIFDSHITKEFSEYSDIEKNELAIKVFYETMDVESLKFKESIEFNPTNEYFLKGSFIKLSNKPKIGWHPEWKNKYLKEDETR